MRICAQLKITRTAGNIYKQLKKELKQRRTSGMCIMPEEG
jgi:hypothetical protein